MIVEKITYGYIVQQFDEEGNFLNQNPFRADGDVSLEDEEGNPLDDLDFNKYSHPFDVK